MSGLDLTYGEAVAYLDSHIGRGMKPGLERITALMEMMGDPQDSYPIIHVAGTNGKTSVSRMATLLLVAHGLTTGTFISPHLERIEERMTVNGQPTSPDDFARAISDVKAFADLFERQRKLTYFELITAAGLGWFADQAVDAAVVEVGLGGRLDATNVCHGEVAVLTGVGLDHTEYLGSTPEEIAAEKLAITEPESVLVVGPVIPEVGRLARRVAAERSATIWEYGTHFKVAEARRGVGGWQLTVEAVHGRYEDLFLPVHGRHQTINLAVAIAAVEGLLGRELSSQAVEEAVSVVTTPGRMEIVARRPLVMLDGAHNPDAFRALGYSLSEEFPTSEWVVVMGVMADKDLGSMIPTLPRIRRVVATSVESPRALSSDVLAKELKTLVDVPVDQIPNRREAIETARELAGPDGAVLVTGSLYLVGAVRALLAGGEAQTNER